MSFEGKIVDITLNTKNNDAAKKSFKTVFVKKLCFSRKYLPAGQCSGH